MATDESFVEHVLDVAALGSRLTSRKMFGEFGFHLDRKFVAMACDNSFFLKHTAAIAAHGLDLPTRPPYPGAKPYPVADELLDTPETLKKVLLDTADSLPESKPGRSSKRKG